MVLDSKTGQIKRDKLSAIVADKIEKLIYERKLKPGEKLPSENELAKHFGVSRNVIRESLISLEERGLVVVKVGKGSFVDISKSKGFDKAVSRIIKFENISIESVFEVRIALEVAACGLSALRATEAEIVELMNLAQKIETAESVEQWIQAEFDFHMLIVKSAKNDLFYYFSRQLTNQLRRVFQRVYLNEQREFAVTDHLDIVKTIMERDVEKASRTMLKHLEESKQRITGR